MLRWIRSSAPALGVALVLAFAPAAVAQDGPASFSTVVKKVTPSVVYLATPQDASQQLIEQLPRESQFRELFQDFLGGEWLNGERSDLRPLGSGFVAESETSDIIVTASKVVGNLDRVQVILPDESTATASVLTVDREADIAVLRLDEAADLPALSWGDPEALEVGDWVVAVGSPHGRDTTVSAGIVSAPPADALRTDARITRGNVGGPLVNLAGETVGITALSPTPTGGMVGYVIPAPLAKAVVDEAGATAVARAEQPGWLGVQVQPVNDALASALGMEEAQGALVAAVVPNGPAARAGIQAGDVILSVNGRKVAGAGALSRLIGTLEAGSTVDLGIMRRGQQTTIEATLGAREQPAAQAERPAEPAGQQAAGRPVEPEGAETEGRPELGVRLAPLTSEIRSELGIEGVDSGVVVVGVKRDGLAAAHGLRPGDVIVEAGGEPVAQPDSVVSKLTEAWEAGADAVVVRVNRDGNFRYLALPVRRA